MAGEDTRGEAAHQAADGAAGGDGTLARQLEELREQADALQRRVEVVASIGAGYEQQLRNARRDLRQLEDLFLPVCMFCKRVRTDDSYWERIERFFTRHADITFSHGICPSCFEEKFGKAGTPPPGPAPRAPEGPEPARPAPAPAAETGEEDGLAELRALLEAAPLPPTFPRPALQRALDRVGRSLARYRKVMEISDHYQEEFRLRLERAVRSDALTGFATRAAAVEAIEDAYARAAAGEVTLALLIVEVRGLRALNRRHGHAVGDRAVVALSRALRTSVPKATLRARWSGAAFALLVEAGDAAAEADAALQALRAVVVTHDGLALSLEVEVAMAAASEAADAGTWMAAAEHGLTDGA